MNSLTKPKQSISVVFLGHVDHGKSTLAGHLIYKCGGIDQSTMDACEQQAKDAGKQSYKFAWITDQNASERDHGITITICVRQIETKHRILSIIDAPGTRDFIKNTITGINQASTAILVVSAVTNEFEAGIVRSGQTFEHALIAQAFGIQTVICAVSKMDAIQYDQQQYQLVCQKVTKVLTDIGFGRESILFVPVSGWIGDNLVEISQFMPWYEDSTLIDLIDSLEIPIGPVNKPLRIPIQDVYAIADVGTVPVGRVESGKLTNGMNLVFAPTTKIAEVTSIESNQIEIPSAKCGTSIGIRIKGLKPIDIKRGYIAGCKDYGPPRACQSFTAKVIILDHPGRIMSGYTPVVDIHMAHVACTFHKLLAKIDRQTQAVLDEQPQAAVAGDCVLIEIIPTKPLCVEKFDEFPALGRFIVRDMRRTVAIGTVIKVTYQQTTDEQQALLFQNMFNKLQGFNKQERLQIQEFRINNPKRTKSINVNFHNELGTNKHLEHVLESRK